MKDSIKDLIHLIIVLVVLAVFVYVYPVDDPTVKQEMYYGVVGGGMTAFIVFFIIKAIKKTMNKKK